MALENSSIAKITRPSPSRIFLRKKLFRFLDKGRKRSIIWISGPPGCGKTTLVSSYLEARKLQNIWYQVDERDTDIASFFYYMRLAAKKANPRKRSNLPLLTPEYLPELPVFTLQFFEKLFHRLPSPSVMVLDNYQLVPDKSQLHEIIRNGLSVIPKGITVLVISRSAPPTPLSRFQANRQMELIGWDALKLTVEDTGKIASLLYPAGKYSRENIRQFHKKTEGWIAGLSLLLRASSGKVQEGNPLSQTHHERIFDYFDYEVFQKMKVKTRNFLLKTAFFPSLSSKIAGDMTGERQAGRILSDLNLNNFFTERKGSRGQLGYQYHSLFQEYLRSKIRKTFTQAHRKKLQRDTANLLKDAGQIEEAAALFIQIEDGNSLARLIQKNAERFLFEGREKTVLEWFVPIRNDTLELNSRLLYWRAMCRMPYSPAESLPDFERAFNLFSSKKDSAGMILSISSAIKTIFHESHNFYQMDHWVRLLGQLKRKTTAHQLTTIENQISPNIFFALVLRRPNHPDFIQWRDRAHQVLQNHENISLKCFAGLCLSIHYLWAGDFPKASIIMRSLSDLTKIRDQAPLDFLVSKATEAFFYFFTAMPEKGLKSVSEGLEKARSSGVRLWDHHLLGFGAANAMTTGALTTAGKFLSQMKSTMNSENYFNLSLYHMLMVWKSLLEGDLHEAIEFAEINLKVSDHLGATLPVAVSNYQMAQILHNMGKRKKAAIHLAKAFKTGRVMNSHIILFMCLLAESRFSFDHGKKTKALQSLKKAMAIGREKGYVNFFMWEPKIMSDLCLKALENNIETEYVKYLISKRNLVPETPPVEEEQWPWPLKIYTMGRFAIVIDGKALKFTGKARKRPLELLKALIAFGGRDVGKDQLSDALWPEADAYAADRAFITTLQRLRKLSGHKEAIQLQEGRLSLNPRYCYVDALAFESLINRVENIKETKIKIELIQKAIGLYKGNFLGKEPEFPWTVTSHEHLRNNFLQCISELGSHYEKKRKWRNAIEFYQKGLEMDDLNEEFYQRLMVCFKQQGNRAKALATYRRCQKILLSILEIEPSLETEAVYKTLLK